MADTARLPARSINGCWTCRLRKKKCDETRPVCSACASRELMCHGYGPRPDWMDNEVMQKDESHRIKQIVSGTKSKNRRRQLHHYSRPTGQLLHDTRGAVDPLFTETIPLPAAPSPSSVSQHQGYISYNGSQYEASGIDLSSIIDPIFGQSLPDVSAISSFNLQGYEVAFTPSLSGESLQYLKSPGFPEVMALSVASLPPMAQDNVGTHANACSHCEVESSAQTLNLGVGIEDSLFMYYLDEVFYVQYPFYHSLGRQGRGWLYSILRRAKSAYHATLALSECRLLSTLPRDNDTTANLDLLRSQNSYYDLALQELQALLESSDVLDAHSNLGYSLEALTTILQLLFWELFVGGSENWQTHLHTACKFFPALLQARAVPPTPFSTRPSRPSDRLHLLNLRPEDDCAIDFLLGSFISLDVISSASTRSGLILDINHLEILNTLQTPLESLIGCRNSVISLILEISLLEEWKKEAQGAHKLSLVDLVKRGDQIKEHIRQELVAIENTPSGGPLLYNPSTIFQTPAPLEISKIFAYSAITYLHVVISGAYPELPEIAESVSETIDAFKSLRDPRLLRSVVWPFCITGCLALEKHQGLFGDLVSKANVTQLTTATCFTAYRIMEECWKARITCSDACDWTVLMNKHGHCVLLI